MCSGKSSSSNPLKNKYFPPNIKNHLKSSEICLWCYNVQFCDKNVHLLDTYHKETIYQSIHAINEIQFMISIQLLRVSAPGCHPQRVF